MEGEDSTEEEKNNQATIKEATGNHQCLCHLLSQNLDTILSAERFTLLLIYSHPIRVFVLERTQSLGGNKLCVDGFKIGSTPWIPMSTSEVPKNKSTARCLAGADQGNLKVFRAHRHWNDSFDLPIFMGCCSNPWWTMLGLYESHQGGQRSFLRGSWCTFVHLSHYLHYCSGDNVYWDDFLLCVLAEEWLYFMACQPMVSQVGAEYTTDDIALIECTDLIVLVQFWCTVTTVDSQWDVPLYYDTPERDDSPSKALGWPTRRSEYHPPLVLFRFLSVGHSCSLEPGHHLITHVCWCYSCWVTRHCSSICSCRLSGECFQPVRAMGFICGPTLAKYSPPLHCGTGKIVDIRAI